MKRSIRTIAIFMVTILLFGTGATPLSAATINAQMAGTDSGAVGTGSSKADREAEKEAKRKAREEERAAKKAEREAKKAARERNKRDTSKGAKYTRRLSSTNWQGTVVYDAAGNDLTAENASFIGLAKYDAATNYYEFFDKETKETRGDEGTFFITADGTKRILISTSRNYQAVVDITELTKRMFTYRRQGVDKEGNAVEVFVDHIPYTESELEFTTGRGQYNSTTGPIDIWNPGRQILGATLWNGTVVKDEHGNDVTDANRMFISLAKFDSNTSQYEFFNLETGQTRGDYGYYDVIYNNKIRTHVAIGQNKYGAVLELTELNPERFTYKRMGKDANGNDIVVFVEHEPYQGAYTPAFTF